MVCEQEEEEVEARASTQPLCVQQLLICVFLLDRSVNCDGLSAARVYVTPWHIGPVITPADFSYDILLGGKVVLYWTTCQC